MAIINKVKVKTPFKKATLRGLKGNYSGGYAVGDVVYRKYGKQWYIYTSRMTTSWGSSRATELVSMAGNSIQYVNNNPDLLEALKKACKPISTINDKIDNDRWSLKDFVISFDPDTGNIMGHEIKVASAEEILSQKQAEKARLEEYNKMPTYGAFLGIGSYKLTYDLRK
jgi:hypothetical protein